MSETVYLFSVNPATPPTHQIESGAEVSVRVRGAFADVPDIRAVPTPFTPACDGHPLTPIAGPIHVRGAEPGDAVAVDLLEIRPAEDGNTAILRDFGVLREEFSEPKLMSCPIREGNAWFGDRIPIPLQPNLGTVSTMPPQGYKPSYAGRYGGDFDQKDVKQGARIHLPVIVPGALVFFADPHAVISDGIISGTGVECSADVRACITLRKGGGGLIDRPIIEVDGTLQVLGFGSTVEEATQDAARAAVGFVSERSPLSREEAYMLLSIIGELRIGTSPRPIMAARLIVPRKTLEDAGYKADPA